MDAEQETRASLFMRLIRTPSRLAKASLLDLTHPEARVLGVEVIKRLIRSNPEKALLSWQTIKLVSPLRRRTFEQLQYELARTVIIDEHDWSLLEEVPTRVKANAELHEMSIRRSLRERTGLRRLPLLQNFLRP